MDKVVAELIKLEQGPLSGAKETVGAASCLKASLKEKLTGGEAFQENFNYFARVKEKGGRASYKRVFSDIIKEHPRIPGRTEKFSGRR